MTTSHDTGRTSLATDSIPTLSARRQWTALVLLMLPVLLVSVDNTVLSFALPAITEDLRPAATTQLWIIDIYSLVLAALLVAMGGAGDRIGRRRLLMIGSVGFGVVSVVAAFAPSAEVLVACRAVLGFFGAMLMPSTLALLRNVFTDPDRRRLAIAVWATGFAAGSSLGPIVGGALLHGFPWGSVFLIAVPILLPLVLFFRLIPESKDPDPGRVDVPSVLLSLITMLPIVWGIKTLAHDGVSVLPIVGLVVGATAGTLFVRRQLRLEHPLLDVRLFRFRPFTGAVLANLLSILGLIGFVFFVSQHLQLVLGLSPLQAGLVLLPGAVVSMIAGLLVVRLVRRWRPQTVIVAGLLLIAAGFVLVVIFRDDLTVAAVIASFVVLEIGLGGSQTISGDTIISSVPAAKSGAAAGISETAYELGAVLGTAVLGTLLTAFYRANVVLPDGLSAAQRQAAGETIGGAVSVAGSLPGAASTRLLDSARTAFDSGIGPLAIIAAALVLVASGIIAWTFRTRRV